jgi:hypothetical protein
MTTVLQAPFAIVQTASVLPSSDAGWTFIPGLICNRAQEGAGQFLGMAETEWHADLNVLPGSLNIPIQTNNSRAGGL